MCKQAKSKDPVHRFLVELSLFSSLLSKFIHGMNGVCVCAMRAYAIYAGGFDATPTVCFHANKDLVIVIVIVWARR